MCEYSYRGGDGSEYKIESTSKDASTLSEFRMTPERWRQVKTIFHEAADCEPSSLAALLDQRCDGDPDLRAEIESLLAAAREPSAALETPFVPEGALSVSTRDTTADPMIGRTIGNYTVTGELARGGMGIVYLARHVALPRDVVLKRVRPALYAENDDVAARFRREAHIQCQLDHPHIVRVLEFFSSFDEWFLVMEYVPGSSVRKLIDERGPLPPDETVRLALQALAALGYAHSVEFTDEKGQPGRTVIHRDIKPANLILDQRGNLKLTDFGIAKLTGERERELTKTGFSPGTFDYMSPEQIRGLNADARSDLYSLGVTIYEMLTGRLPFPSGKTSSGYDLQRARVETDPVPVHAVNSGIPVALSEMVAVSLAREPEQRWQSAAEFAAALTSFQNGTQSPAIPRVVPVRTSGLRARRRAVIALASLAVLSVLALLGWFLTKRTQGDTQDAVSVAVLPFADLSPAKDQAYFCQGLAEELLNELSRVPDIRVIGTVSSSQLGSGVSDLPAAAKKLHINAIVQGSVRTQNNHTRISARLVQAGDGAHLWAATYDVELHDYLSVQEGLAIAIAGALHKTLRPKADFSIKKTSNPEALKAYMEGRLFAQKRTKANMESAASSFERALKLDPSYAKAWAALAEVRSNQAGLGEIPSSEGYRLARDAIQKALALDPNLSDAYAALGRIQLLHDWDWAGADASFQRTRALEPGGVRAIWGAAMVARILGRMDEAVALSRVSIQSDPLNASAFHNAGLAFYWAGRNEEAAAALKRSLELVPEKAITHDLLGQVYLAQGRFADALAEAEQEKEPALKLGGLALAYHALHRNDESDRKFAELKRDHADDPALIAEIHAYRGEVDQAFEWLEKAYNERDPGLTQLKGTPLYTSLRRDPRYAALLKKLRLPL